MSAQERTGHNGSAGRLMLVVWATIVVAMAYAIIAGGGSADAGVNATKYRIISLVLLATALAVWLVAASINEFWRPRSLMSWAIAAAVLALGTAALGSSQPRIGADYLAYGVLLAGAYVLLQRLFAHGFFGERLGNLAVVFAYLTTAAYLAAVMLDWSRFWGRLGRFEVPPLRPFGEGIWWGNPAAVATAAVLLALAATAHLGTADRSRRRLAVGIAILASITVFLTGTRGVWIALAGTSIVVLVVWLRSNRDRARAIFASRRRAPVVGITVGLVILLGLGFGSAITSRLTEPASDRIAFANASIGMFLDHPLTGVGPGMWAVDRLQYTQAPQLDSYVSHAHNLVLQTLAELGLVGAASGLIVLLLLVRLTFVGTRSATPLIKRSAWAALTGGVFLFIQQMTTSYVNAAGIVLCYALIVARLDALLSVQDPTSGRAFVPAGIAMALAFGGAVTWLSYSELAAQRNDEAVVAADQGVWPTALSYARQAHASDPLMPPYQFTLGVAEANTGDEVAALAHISASASVDDYPIAWLDVARLRLDSGRVDDARAALARAMRLGYQQPQVAFGSSLMFDELGDRSAAIDALSDALVAAPTLASDPFWLDPGRQTLLAEALTAAIDRADPPLSYRLALEGGRYAHAAAIVAAMPKDQREIPDLVVRSWVGDAVAFQGLLARAREDPRDLGTVLMCLRIAQRSQALASQSIGWTCSHVSVPDIPVLVRVVPHRVRTAPLPGVAPGGHFRFVYRRVAPFNQLVPGIPELSTLPIGANP